MNNGPGWRTDYALRFVFVDPDGASGTDRSFQRPARNQVIAMASLCLLAGCTSVSDSGARPTTTSGTTSNTGGIDPVTLAGIEDSNRATQEAADRQFNETQQMINTQNMIDTQNMVNEQNAAAAAAMSQP